MLLLSDYKSTYKSMEKSRGRRNLFFALSFFLLAMILTMQHVQTSREALAERLAPSVLRFHILANSDRGEDQEIKLEIRSLILDYISQGAESEAAAGESSLIGPASTNKSDMEKFIRNHKKELTALSDSYLRDNGFNYTSHVDLVRDYFPTRVYDQLVVPCGWYDALRVTLGNGDGHNWWCVLYPKFCFTDAVCKVVPEESMQALESELKRDDFLALKDSRPNVKFRFLFFPTLQFHNPTLQLQNLPDSASQLPDTTLQLPDPQSPNHKSP